MDRFHTLAKRQKKSFSTINKISIYLPDTDFDWSVLHYIFCICEDNHIYDINIYHWDLFGNKYTCQKIDLKKPEDFSLALIDIKGVEYSALAFEDTDCRSNRYDNMDCIVMEKRIEKFMKVVNCVVKTKHIDIMIPKNINQYIYKYTVLIKALEESDYDVKIITVKEKI